jgi:NDP-sugar pyrophosphorylase family protein
MDDRLIDIPAVLLVGGRGTRLRSVVNDRPKPLALVGGRPFLCYILEQLAAAGVRTALLCCGYRGELVEHTFGRRFDRLELEYQHETQPRGTAGALLEALPRLVSPTILVANGDSYCASDLRLLVHRHRLRRAAATLLLTEVDEASRYGRVECNGDGRIVRFVEKGSCNAPAVISAGMYLFERDVLQSLVALRPTSLEHDVFPHLIGRGLCGHVGGGAFLDIGTPESYAQAESFFASIGAGDGRISLRGACGARRSIMLGRAATL